MMKLREAYRQLSRGKKLIILLMILTAMETILVITTQDVSVSKYVCMCIIAFGYLMIAYSGERLHDAYRKTTQIQRATIIMKDTYIDMLEHLNGLTEAQEKVEALPKVASATGQIYVDYDEVIRILEGGDFVER